jgi:diguanylate cyclase (GGDEF)-like protein/PAS domain S-box-containing protein
MCSYDSHPTETLPELNKPEFLSLFSRLKDAVSVIAGTRIAFVNQAYADMLEYDSPADLLDRDIGDLIDPTDRDMVLARGARRMKGEASPDFYEFSLVGKYRTHLIQVRSIPVRFEGEVAVLTIARDITLRKETEDQLKVTLSLLESTLESTADGISTVDLQGNIINYNLRFLELLGVTEEDFKLRMHDRQLFMDRLAQSLVSPNSYQEGVTKVYENPEKTSYDVLEFKDGRVVERFTFPQTVGGETVGIVWSLRDVTQRRRLEALLQHHATHDHLTDLLNRRGFEEALEAQLQELLEGSNTGALLLLDLDQFKDINDSLGHPAGDEVLIVVADLIKRALPEGAIVARLGGDEFGIVLPGAGAYRAEVIGQQLLLALNRRVFQVVSGDRVRVTCSLGVVLYPAHGSTVEQLMSRVDLALYGAKEKGRNRFMIYSPVERRAKKSEDRLSMRWAIRDALDNNTMMLFAQPIRDLTDNTVAQYELLLRLPLEDGRVLRAGQFIGLAERSGLIQAIDHWVINQAILLLKKTEGQPFSLAVNLSGAAFEDSRLLSAIEASLRGHAAEPSRLVFEVTETAAVSNVSGALKFIGNLKDIGCRFSIDDFGVGFSSMTQLKHLPADYLKIDGSFIRHIRTSTVDQEVVKAMVAIAGALGMTTIAESVRSAADLELLKQLGVRYAQGYHVGRPRPADRVLQFDAHTRAA